ncbi:MAG TPA: hypothetical protein VFY14_04025 [Streptomyces sp.]|nr:hypothetical protein [Streptomyces sp.]
MRAFSTNYRSDDPRPGTPLNRGFWLHGIPRPLLLCRLLGHRPVVDGYGPEEPGLHAARWVCCDRCGIRPDPQGNLDPDQWDVGDRYTGPQTDSPPRPLTTEEIKRMAAARVPFTVPAVPGPWPHKNTGAIGGQVVIGRSFPGWEIEVKIGNQGSEHTLAAHIRLYPFGALYLHTERFGTWLQRRLNPTGYQSRVTGLAIQHGGIDWRLWAKRDESSRHDPWWMRGTIPLDPRDRLFGRRRYDYEDIGAPVTTAVRMPHGDDHQVTLLLQRCTHGRTRRRRFHSWSVHWSTRPGIPVKPHGGEVLGSAVEVSHQAVTEGTWPVEAAAAIAAQLTRHRTRYGMKALPTAPKGTRPEVGK